MMTLLPERIAKKVMPVEDGCWLWTAGLFTNGYGSVYWDGQDRKAHRLIYELLVGPIPAELTIDHLCRVRSCVNPDHMEPVSRGENVLRGNGVTAANAAKTQCLHGHPFDETNTHITAQGYRFCRSCNRIRQRRYRGMGR